MIGTGPQDRADAQTGATLARGAFFNALAFLASRLRGIFILLVARLLGSAVLGTFVLAWAVTDIVSKFATLGLDFSTMAFVARSEARGDRAASRRIMNAALLLALGARRPAGGLPASGPCGRWDRGWDWSPSSSGRPP